MQWKINGSTNLFFLTIYFKIASFKSSLSEALFHEILRTIYRISFLMQIFLFPKVDFIKPSFQYQR